MDNVKYTATSLEDLAKALESLGLRARSKTTGKLTKAEKCYHDGQADAFRTSADIVRNTKLD